MEDHKGQVRFEWREGLALVCALGRGALDSDPESKALAVRGLVQVAAYHRSGGTAAFERLPRRMQERLLAEETKATRGALARLGDLGLVVWDYSHEDDELSYRLTELGWDTAMRFGRGVARARQAAAAAGGVAVAG